MAFLAACGGGGGDSPAALQTETVGTDSVAAPAPSGSNVAQVLVDTGTDGTSINTPFVTVTICQPGTAACVEIDHVVLDTGSSGLRVAASAVPASLNLPVVTNAVGELVGECAQFASGFSWGSVRRADVQLAGERAANLPIQVVNDTNTPWSMIPAACSNTGANIGPGRGAKGILGLGLFTEDCGPACVGSTAPNVYFACNGGGGCTSTRLALASQVANPVTSFAVNNNGVVLTLPEVPTGGAGRATGSLVFGIGTQPNNQLGTATVFATDSDGFFTTTYKGVDYPRSFLDSGSNGLFFNDGSLPSCGDFYCPPGAPLTLTATNLSDTGTRGTVTFTLDSVTAIRPHAAVAHIGGTNGLPGSFDWGLPFFFGRSVFVAREGAPTPAGPGPYWAY
ncbi:DUF3443 domain-containing protein [Ramlibacter sp.]|uniref:DUF3443 domain-containing protein n=1 Tax=Ramlibacter sp. TaxID=1917967 RepID=UPI002D42A059|nr:DUF3443 domain-containing protein [Ramlibacter sp.]HYD74490.1 DUF3443 domain-containing protein [Ramlibacter sp.]